MSTYNYYKRFFEDEDGHSSLKLFKVDKVTGIVYTYVMYMNDHIWAEMPIRNSPDALYLTFLLTSGVEEIEEKDLETKRIYKSFPS